MTTIRLNDKVKRIHFLAYGFIGKRDAFLSQSNRSSEKSLSEFDICKSKHILLVQHLYIVLVENNGRPCLVLIRDTFSSLFWLLYACYTYIFIVAFVAETWSEGVEWYPFVYVRNHRIRDNTFTKRSLSWLHSKSAAKNYVSNRKRSYKSHWRAHPKIYTILRNHKSDAELAAKRSVPNNKNNKIAKLL